MVLRKVHLLVWGSDNGTDQYFSQPKNISESLTLRCTPFNELIGDT